MTSIIGGIVVALLSMLWFSLQRISRQLAYLMTKELPQLDCPIHEQVRRAHLHGSELRKIRLMNGDTYHQADRKSTNCTNRELLDLVAGGFITKEEYEKEKVSHSSSVS